MDQIDQKYVLFVLQLYMSVLVALTGRPSLIPIVCKTGV